MTAVDTVARAAALMGATSVEVRRPAKVDWTTCYTARISGTRAVALMERLLPKMGLRRSARIADILATVSAPRPRSGKITVAQGSAIAERFRAGESAENLAAEHGISKWSVYALHQGRYFQGSLCDRP